MLRLFAVPLAALLLTGCIGVNSLKDNELKREDFSVTCLEGVSYWVRASGHKSYMAPRYDKNTLQPVRCSE